MRWSHCYFCRDLDYPAPGTHNFWIALSIAEPRAWPELLGTKLMARLNALLRSTRSRIGRRLAQIVDIAAASLPTAGA